MKRAVIIGNSGGGKSTLARRLTKFGMAIPSRRNRRFVVATGVGIDAG
jgi:predicted ATPase